MSTPSAQPSAQPAIEGLGVQGLASEEARTTRRGPTPDELLEGLNEPQRAAVRHAGRPLLVVAGAGSGKTRVLTRRIAWLISERKAHPGSILAITFTNKAAAEMKERVEELVGGGPGIMWVTTFHSACVRILRKEIDKLGYKSQLLDLRRPGPEAADDDGLKDLDLDPRALPARPGAALGEQPQERAARPRGGRRRTPSNHLEETYAAAYTLYQRRLREANALDFDDLIMTTVHLMQTFPEVRETYRRRFRHVLVDEYQDTNHAQYALIHQLCADDRRARRRASRRRAGRADGGRRRRPVDLRLPRRQHPQHPRLRAGLPRRHLDPARAELPLDPDHPHRRQRGDRPQPGPQGEAAVVGRRRRRADRRVRRRRRARRGAVRRRRDRQAHRRRRQRPGDVAVFYRTNAQSRVFEEVFIRTGQPYKVVGGRALLRAPRGPRRAGLPADAGQPRRRGLACGASSTSPSAASATAPSSASTRSPSASGSRSGRRCAAPTRRPASPPAR